MELVIFRTGKLITFAGADEFPIPTPIWMRQRLCLLRLSSILRMRKYFQWTSARVEPSSAKNYPQCRNAQGSHIKINRIEATGAGTGRERDWDRDRDCRDNKRCSMPTEWAEYGGKRKLGLFMARYEWHVTGRHQTSTGTGGTRRSQKLWNLAQAAELELQKKYMHMGLAHTGTDPVLWQLYRITPAALTHPQGGR